MIEKESWSRRGSGVYVVVGPFWGIERLCMAACEAHSVRVCLVFLVGRLWRRGVWNSMFALFYFINIIIGFLFGIIVF